MRLTSAVPLFLLAGAVAPCAIAQSIAVPTPDTAIGESPLAKYDVSEIDNVNPINGNLYLNIPLLSFPQRGQILKLAFRIFYNDKGWMIHYNNTTTDYQPVPAMVGYWEMPNAVGAYIARDQFATIGVQQTVVASQINNAWGGNNSTTTYNSYFVKSNDGSLHYIADQADQACQSYGAGIACNEMYGWISNSYPATDGSGFIETSNGSAVDTNGTVYTSTTMTDVDGNSIQSTSNGWLDTVNRLIPGSYTQPGYPPPNQDLTDTNSLAEGLLPGVETAPSNTLCPAGTKDARVWAVPGPGATTVDYYLCYSDVQYYSAFHLDSLLNTTEFSGVGESSVGVSRVLTSVVLPNKTSYTFAYDNYLSLTNLTLPTGGSIAYTWQTIPFQLPQPPSPTCCNWPTAPVSRALSTRTIFPGNGQPSQQWTYHWYLNQSGPFGAVNYSEPSYSVVTDPNGNDTEHVIGGPNLNSGGLGYNFLVETATNTYAGCSPHDTSATRTCNSSTSILLMSKLFGLTPILSGGVGIGSPSYYATLTPTAKPTTTRTLIPTTSGSTLESKTVVTLSPAYGTCSPSSLGPVVEQGTNPPPTVQTISPCYMLDQSQAVATYDFGSGSPGPLLSTSTTAYVWNSGGSQAAPYTQANLLNLVRSKTVSDAASETASETDFGYDEAGSPQGTYGHLTSVKKVGLNDLAQSIVTAASATTSAVYNANGTIQSVSDPKGNITNVTYQCSGSLPWRITNALNQVTAYQFDCGTGLLTGVWDPNDLASGGGGTQFTYDTVRNPTNVTRPDGGSTTINYGGYAVPWTVTRTVTASPDPSIVTSTVYDGFLKSTVQTLANGATSEMTYDLLGRLSSVTTPHTSTSQQTDGTTYAYYDALSRKIQVQNPDGSSKWWCYNGLASNSQPNCYAQAWASGKLEWVDEADEAGSDWQRASNGLGQMTKVMEPLPVTPILSTSRPVAGQPALETDYSYNVMNELTNVSQGSEARSFTYDSLGRLVTSNNPETGSICYGLLSAGSCANGYDLNGNLVAKTDARGKTTTYLYDNLNRLTSKTFNDATPSESYAYDQWTGWGIPEANGIGRLVEQQVQAGTVYETVQVFGYDPMGRLATMTACDPSECGAGGYQASAVYDQAGHMTDLIYPDGHDIHSTFDSAGRLGGSSTIAVQDRGTGVAYVNSVSYLNDDSPGVLTLGNGVSQTITKNNRLQPLTISVAGSAPQFPSSGWVSNTYAYGSIPPTCIETGGIAKCGFRLSTDNGNIVSITDSLNSSRTQTFTYDALNRITSFTAGTTSQAYGLDRYGNMWGNSGVLYIPTFNTANQINGYSWANPSQTIFPTPPQPPVPTYDASGNQTTDQDQNGLARTYAYDAEGRTSQITSAANPGTPFVSYVYAADGSRIRKTNNGSNTFTEYAYFSGRPIAEKDQMGAWTDYIYANGNKIASTRTFDRRIEFKGVAVNAGGQIFMNMAIPVIPITSGDRLCWDQYNGKTVGGLAVAFSNGTWTGWGPLADDGQSTNQDYEQGGWFYRCFDLDGYAGVNLVQLEFAKDLTTPAGPWSLLFADLSVIHADGTVVPLYNDQPTASFSVAEAPQAAYDTNVSIGVVSTMIGQDPIVSSTATAAFSRDTHFFLDDHLGTAQMEFAAGGWPLWRGQFAPFGAELDSGTTANHYKFTGKERDAESGLDNFGPRYFASTMDRFMSPDPGNVGVRIENPQSWNMYSYSLNNPLTFTDPTGLYVCEDSTNCDSKNDQAFAKSLSDARTAANNLTGDDKTAALRAIDAYGAQGVDNGVNVRFDANIKGGDAVTEVSGVANGNKSADNPTGQNINVTFKPDAVGGDLSGSLVAHEGSHVADGSDWVKSGFSASMDPTRNTSEMNANHVQFNIINSTLGAMAGPNGTYTGSLYGGSVNWKNGDTFKMITPDLQKAVQKANGSLDTKPVLTPGAKLQP